MEELLKEILLNSHEILDRIGRIETSQSQIEKRLTALETKPAVDPRRRSGNF